MINGQRASPEDLLPLNDLDAIFGRERNGMSSGSYSWNTNDDTKNYFTATTYRIMALNFNRLFNGGSLVSSTKRDTF